MNILINNKPADITLDTEKTLGDVLSGIELWLSQSGNRIRNVSVDGTDASGDTLSALFGRNIRDIKKLDITVASWRELAAQALFDLLETCTCFGNAAFGEREPVINAWEGSAASRFLASDIADIHKLAGDTLKGEGISVQDLRILIEERLREISEPDRELFSTEALVKSTAERMEELPLDIQTGNDQRAAETIQLFSRVGEKLFRILFIRHSDGLSMDTFTISGIPARSFFDDFNGALRELGAAYQNKDTVLAGDIAEYELSPRLLNFFTALKNITKSIDFVASVP